MNKYTFTSESVSEGHPDKVCDALSDAILDEYLSQDPTSRVACETMATTGTVFVSGEVTSSGSIDVEKIVKSTLNEIGYNDPAFGMDCNTVKIISMLDKQSPEIAQGVNEGDGLHEEQGAGDQGLMFGFACNETDELMPLPIHLSHRLVEKMTELRKSGVVPWLRPDSKSQVSVLYHDDLPVSISKVVIATQHDDMLSKFSNEKEEHSFVEKEIIDKVIKPILDTCGLPYSEDFIVNGTGRFVFGGPEADTGLTGRKIIVDTYGGYAPHGGGAFSGKDPSKVDRSAAYMARYIAKNIVAAELANKCEVQFSYSIGVAEPTSFYVKSFGTSEHSDENLTKLAQSVFPLKPAGIINHLQLKYPRYRQTAAYGHFGRENNLFTWEQTDMVEALQKKANKRN
ncbi:MAG: methionine adenosyltransferase [Candidatus Neomarinimicrobiota bacterium]|nr:methionine adenosyltransferase [Candidatus Neomarinimicrobiota bacterium]